MELLFLVNHLVVVEHPLSAQQVVVRVKWLFAKDMVVLVSVVAVGPPPIGKISFPEIVPEIKDCGVMSPEYIAKLTDIEFYEFNFTEEQNAKIYNDFMDRINSLACL